MNLPAIPVDLLNPGQVFACLGFMELAHLLCGPVAASFDWSDDTSPQFLLHSPTVEDPFMEVLNALKTAEVEIVVPVETSVDLKQWKLSTSSYSQSKPWPIPMPESPSALPARLSFSDGKSLLLSSWGEGFAAERLTTERDNMKFWAGSKGKPGASFFNDALKQVQDAKTEDLRLSPFSYSLPKKSSLRFDFRGDYTAIDIGFTVNAHGSIKTVGYPVVEVLAAVGISNARAERLGRLSYRYGVVSSTVLSGASESGGRVLLPPALLRVALGAQPLPFPTRVFHMALDWPGQEGQARCITVVTEEFVQHG